MSKAYCLKAIRDGYVPIAPHLLYPQILDDNDPEQRKFGLELGLGILENADELWVCGPEISRGMQIEMDTANRWGIPVVMVPNIDSGMEQGNSIEAGIRFRREA